MKLVLSFIFMIMVAAVYADDNNLPTSCKPLQLKEGSLILAAEKPVLVMIHNTSSTDIWITHPVSEPSANAGWSSHLQAGNWSALALDKDGFELSCIESKPGHEQQIPCGSVISVCNWSTVVMSAKEKGTFWAGENMPLPGLLTHLGGRGFELPAS